MKMTKTKLFGAAMSVVMWMASPIAMAQDEHDHDHDHGAKAMSFTSVSAGLKTLNDLIAEARAKVAKGDFEGLHETSEEVHGAADGLAARLTDISMENKERYKFNTEQLKSLSSQLEEAHEAKNKEDAEKVTKRLESVRDRLKSLAPAG
jgi:molybdenum-dependent DNA-binding transcriptional regulator ModE